MENHTAFYVQQNENAQIQAVESEFLSLYQYILYVETSFQFKLELMNGFKRIQTISHNKEIYFILSLQILVYL